MSVAELDLALVVPPGRCTRGGSYHAVPPEGLARLAAWASRQGHGVAIVDCLAEGYQQRHADGDTVRYGLPATTVARRLGELRPRVVGFSCPFTCIASDVLEMARAVREQLPEALLVLGGAHAAAWHRQILLAEPAIDLIALGEGELALVELLAGVTEGGLPYNIPGFAGRQGTAVQRRPPRQVLDLERQPLPAWELFDLAAYAAADAPHYGRGAGRRFLPTSWSRGCLGNCGFCLSPSHWGRRNWRRRAVASVEQEARQLVERFAISELHVQDDCLLADRKWFLDCLQALAGNGLELALDFSNGLDISLLDEQVVDALARARTVRLALACDCGPQPAPPWSKKTVDPTRARRVARSLRLAGISCVGFFMLGFPGQTLEQMQATVDFALELELDRVSFFVATPFPGTPLYEFCRRRGLLVDEDDFRSFRFSHGHIETPEFSPRDVERLRREGWQAFQARRR